MLLYQLPGLAIFFYSFFFFFFFFFFWFLASKINHYQINGLHLFLVSFEWFYLQISNEDKYIFFLSRSRHCDRGLIVVNKFARLDLWPEAFRTGMLEIYEMILQKIEMFEVSFGPTREVVGSTMDSLSEEFWYTTGSDTATQYIVSYTLILFQ